MKIDLMNGNCLELLKTIPDKSVDIVLTDPPYGTTACKWDNVIPFEPMWEQLHRVTKDNGAICLFGSEPFSSHLRMSNIKRFKYDWFVKKNFPSGVNFAKKQPMRTVEVVSVFALKPTTYVPQMRDCAESVKKRWKDGELMTLDSALKGSTDHKIYNSYKRPVRHKVLPHNLLEFKWPPRSKGTLHPTQKPVALLEYLIKTYTLEGETVLDFTMGSGSTGVACKNLNRSFIGIELDKHYFDIATARINGDNELLEQLKKDKKGA